MRPLTWALKKVLPLDLHKQSGIHAQGNLEIVKNYQIAPHKQKSVAKKNWREDGPSRPV